MGLADLHTHTIYSYDGTASVQSVLKRAQEVGLNIIAITDHDEIRGSLKALELANQFNLEVIPGIEVTTADGDLLALNVTQIIPRGLPLMDTVKEVGRLGGFCIAPHPTAEGLGMKSLNWQVILKAIRDPEAANILIGVETYNATMLDRKGNQYAEGIANRWNIAKVSNSDAHVLEAIGLGATEFLGTSAKDLLTALRKGTTVVRKKAEWNSLKILGSWVKNYAFSAADRFALAAQ